LSGLRGCRVFPLVGGQTRSSCATIHANQGQTITFSQHHECERGLTKMIFVSSNSCCTRMMLSACRGSWYFCRYVASAGKEMDEGFEYESTGTEVENSSRTLLRSEKATRTGYSWSVIITATLSHPSAFLCFLDIYEEWGDQTHQRGCPPHPGCSNGQRMHSPARSVAGMVGCARRRS
jgi:hypothetical protein